SQSLALTQSVWGDTGKQDGLLRLGSTACVEKAPLPRERLKPSSTKAGERSSRKDHAISLEGGETFCETGRQTPITAKSGDTFHDIHPRAEVANLTAHGVSSVQDAVLKRLSLLEDIVYRQLNGLSKSLGLIEGYGGRGKGGLPATLSPEEEEKAKGPHEKYGYNSYLSEKISLDRSIPDYRPTKLEVPKVLPSDCRTFTRISKKMSRRDFLQFFAKTVKDKADL
uniref:Uncharacterized protein n=1 Tax=Accipiter nisus TaxID=211598 RepID=A0A8B9NR39_9AVES